MEIFGNRWTRADSQRASFFSPAVLPCWRPSLSMLKTIIMGERQESVVGMWNYMFIVQCWIKGRQCIVVWLIQPQIRDQTLYYFFLIQPLVRDQKHFMFTRHVKHINRFSISDYFSTCSRLEDVRWRGWPQHPVKSSRESKSNEVSSVYVLQ